MARERVSPGTERGKNGKTRRVRQQGRVVDFPAPAARRPKLAITGGSSLLGSGLLRALLARGSHDVVVFDLVPPPDFSPHVEHRFLDLNLPHADGTVLKLLLEERPDVIVHLAAVRSPSREATYAHELNAIGPLHVLAAAGEAGVPRIILGGTTLVYGARGDNPNYLTEEHRLRPDPRDRFVGDFVEAESHARQHAKTHPDARVTVLRFAPLLSPEVRDFRTRLFESPVVMTLLGYDPILQFLDPDDAVDALLRTIDTPTARGVFNIAPDGVIPLSTTLMMYGALPVPFFHPLAYALQETAWLAGVGVMPGVHAHYLRYLCVADNAKARRVLGFAPSKTTLETVLATARARRGRGRALDWDALEDAVRRAAYRFDRAVRKGRNGETAAKEPEREKAVS
jgi:UDP-glucose 4-epimerase